MVSQEILTYKSNICPNKYPLPNQILRIYKNLKYSGLHLCFLESGSEGHRNIFVQSQKMLGLARVAIQPRASNEH